MGDGAESAGEMGDGAESAGEMGDGAESAGLGAHSEFRGCKKAAGPGGHAAFDRGFASDQTLVRERRMPPLDISPS